MPITAGLFEVIETPLYDTVALPIPQSGDADQAPAELFVVPLYKMARVWPGTQFRSKSYQETNLLESGMLNDASHAFAISSIRAIFRDVDGSILPISSRYYSAASLRLVLASKEYYRAPLWRVADPSTMFFLAHALHDFQQHERTELVRCLRHRFEEPLLIERAMPFSCSVDFDPAIDWHSIGAPAALVVLLEGELGRPVM